MLRVIKIKCSMCGKEIERTKRIDNAICFECKKKIAKVKRLERMPKRKVQKSKPDLLDISWEDMRKQLAQIRYENYLIKSNK